MWFRLPKNKRLQARPELRLMMAENESKKNFFFRKIGDFGFGRPTLKNNLVDTFDHMCVSSEILNVQRVLKNKKSSHFNEFMRSMRASTSGLRRY